MVNLIKLSIILCILSLCPFTAASASCCNKSPPFEKIYVSPRQILSTPYGTYYINPKGEQIQVSTVSSDYNGTFVILTSRQCNNCGKVFKGPIASSEGYNCTFD